MPVMTTMPNLSPAPSPASTARLPSGTGAPSNISGVANAPGTTSTPKTPKTAGAAADSDSAPDSFASVLQGQLAQAAMADQPKPVATLLSDLADQPKPVATLLSDLALQPKPVTTLLSDLALQPKPVTTLLSDLALQPKPVATLLSDLALQPKPVTTLLSDLALHPKPVAALLAELALQTKPVDSQGADLSAKPEDLAIQEIPDDGLPPLSPTLFSLMPNTPIKLDADLPAMEKKPGDAPAEGPLLASVASALIPTHMPSAKDTPQAVIDKSPPETANKTAEFAVLLATSADAVPAQSSHGESAAGAGASFENLLAAAHMGNQSRAGEVHSPLPAATALPVQTPVGAHGWDGEVSDKLVWMVGRQEQRAELVLNPPQLGRVEVSLSMNGDQTSAMFVSSNPAVRDALEAALPRLREMLADAGINLGQAQVGADTGSNAANQSANNRENRDNSGLDSSTGDGTSGGDTLRPVGVSQWLKQANGLVDVFA